jgi:hypothetical protein
MTRLFVLHADADAVCADRLALDLTNSGYHVDKDVQAFDAKGELQPYTPKLNLVGCAAVIVLWSPDTPQAEMVRNALSFAQGMHKYLVTIALDNVLVPATLQSSQTVTSSRATCDTLAALLMPHLPPTQNTDPLLTIYEQAIDASAPVRIEAIAHAEAMLKNGQHRRRVSALLEVLASDDTITSVSDAAYEAISRTKSSVPALPPQAVPQQSYKGSLFTSTCRNGHTNTFDKNEVCRRNQKVVRGTKEQLILHCPTPNCGLEMYPEVDCEGYK